MTMLRRPGSIVAVHLPSEHYKPEEDRMVVHVKVPNQALFSEIEQISGGDFSNFEVGRRVVGLIVDRIDNLFVTGSNGEPEPFSLDREKSGYLTIECAEWISCYLSELVHLILELPKMKEVDRKNS